MGSVEGESLAQVFGGLEGLIPSELSARDRRLLSEQLLGLAVSVAANGDEAPEEVHRSRILGQAYLESLKARKDLPEGTEEVELSDYARVGTEIRRLLDGKVTAEQLVTADPLIDGIYGLLIKTLELLPLADRTTLLASFVDIGNVAQNGNGQPEEGIDKKVDSASPKRRTPGKTSSGVSPGKFFGQFYAQGYSTALAKAGYVKKGMSLKKMEEGGLKAAVEKVNSGHRRALESEGHPALVAYLVEKRGRDKVEESMRKTYGATDATIEHLLGPTKNKGKGSNGGFSVANDTLGSFYSRGYLQSRVADGTISDGMEPTQVEDANLGYVVGYLKEHGGLGRGKKGHEESAADLVEKRGREKVVGLMERLGASSDHIDLLLGAQKEPEEKGSGDNGNVLYLPPVEIARVLGVEGPMVMRFTRQDKNEVLFEGGKVDAFTFGRAWTDAGHAEAGAKLLDYALTRVD